MNDYDQVEEDLKKKAESKKKIKESGRSVFEIKKIIEKKGDPQDQQNENEK